MGPLLQIEIVVLDKNFNTNVSYEKLKSITTQILAHPKALKNITTETYLVNNVNINLACKVYEDTHEKIRSILKTHKDALKQTHVKKWKPKSPKCVRNNNEGNSHVKKQKSSLPKSVINNNEVNVPKK